eukprot:TRINITY_DN239_c0_g1_i1.p1 TRINITY_DN239_c0_g1~~TRINITY_DN239_c0_g1_i1.p1  ORF type:complete len:294 (-),score=68.17 TRINITY_DN239_c0_g1_i1:49-801(-)
MRKKVQDVKKQQEEKMVEEKTLKRRSDTESTKPNKLLKSSYKFVMSANLTDKPLSIKFLQLFDGDGKEPTHLVMLNLKRTQKLLSGLAKGVWILKWQYCKDCISNDTLLECLNYEWTGDEIFNNKVWSGAPRYWRQQVARGKPAFKGLRIAIHGKTVPPTESMTKIIKEGCGTNVNVDDPDIDWVITPGSGVASDVSCSLSTISAFICPVSHLYSNRSKKSTVEGPLPLSRMPRFSIFLASHFSLNVKNC